MSSRTSLPVLLGGTAVRPEGPPAWPVPDADVEQALLAAYRSGAWGMYHGGNVETLERHLAEYHEVEFALACASGTIAVELALRALAVGPGAEVILAAYDYPGNFLGIHAVGALPVLVDVAPGNWNLDPDRLHDAIGPATRAMIVSHLHGGIVPMREVLAIAREKGVSVIEDAAQAPGSRVQGRRAGTWGDVGILSFGGSKLLSAGRGGALLTRRADVHQRARTWQNRGNLVAPLSELQAAVLLPQLAKLDARNRQRLAQVELLQRDLADVPGLRFFINSCTDSQPGYYKLGLQLDEAAFGLSRDRLVAAVRAEGIALAEGFRAAHVGRSPSRYRAAGSLTEAERTHHGVLILHHPVLLGSAAAVAQVAEALRKIQHHAEHLRS